MSYNLYSGTIKNLKIWSQIDDIPCPVYGDATQECFYWRDELCEEDIGAFFSLSECVLDLLNTRLKGEQ